MLYRIYCLKNKENEVVYVGQTIRELTIRLSEHKRRFPNRENYTIHLIKETNNCKEADELETFYIRFFDTVENGENITYGKGTKGLKPWSTSTSFKKGNKYCKMGTKKVECIETGIIYNSITECAKELGLNPSHITACCKGKRKTTGKKHFKYI